MREIIFRAWDKKNKNMVNYIHMAPEYGWLIMADNDAMCERERAERGQWIIMEFTGIKDRKGKNIYESDILRASDQYGIENTGMIVKWVKIGWGPELALLSKDVEVIGNIYENPDLLTHKPI